MALRELKDRLGRSFEEMRNSSTLDETKCMNEITGALLDADIPKNVVDTMMGKIQETINNAAASDKGRLLYQAFFDELSRCLDPRKSAIIEDKRERNIFMFVGLRGSGKSNTCGKYARHHLKKGFKPALVCADIFRKDAFISLKKAAGNDVPVYGSYNGEDPAQIARGGIAKSVLERRDFIVVDTSEKWNTMFVEMRELAEAVRPNLVILVIDGSIGQAALIQALALKKVFGDNGVVIVTNIKDNSKAIAALGAVAAVECPMILAESGEFEAFEARAFVRCLLENPWLSPANQHVDKTLKKDKYTLRDRYTYYKKEFELEKKPHRNRNIIDGYLTIMESMTDEELDKSIVSSKEPALEIATRANVDVKEVAQLIATYNTMARLWKVMDRAVRKEPRKPV